MFYRIFTYLIFLAKSTNQHGVHSPFVYSLVTKCFYKKVHFPQLKSINHKLSKKRAALFLRLVAYFKPSNILEIGTSLGFAKTDLNTKTTLHTVKDISKDTETALQSFDLIFFNENRQKEATISNFEKYLPSTHNDSVFIFNGIHRSKKVEEAWSFIKNHPKVKVTIDTYQWGFVFFRREQHKEHFVIRI